MGPKNEQLEYRLSELDDELSDLFEDISQTCDLGKTSIANPQVLRSFRARLSRLDNTLEKFLPKVAEAKRLAHSLNRDTDHYDAMRKTARTRFYEAVSYEQETPADQTSPRGNASFGSFSSPSGLGVKLPMIHLPIFEGDLASWASFRDTFTALIHNNQDLSPIQKFHYLKSSLRGPALQTIAHIPITAVEYDQAWACLLKRYDNKRILATNYLAKIFGFQPVQSGTLTSLHKFSEIVFESVSAFKALNLPDEAGFILMTFALKLLDGNSRRQFELEQCDKPEIPTFQTLRDFVHNRCLALQSEAVLSKSTHSAPHASSVSKTEMKRALLAQGQADLPNTCPLCKDKHRLYRCPTFNSLKPQERLQRVKRLGICINCLAPNHFANKCTSTGACRLCNQRHHTMLHFLSNSCDDSRGYDLRSSDRDNSNPVGEARKNGPGTQKKQGVPTGDGINNHSVPNAVLSTTVCDSVGVLLGTALARIEDRDGNLRDVRLVIDSGSQRSFITKRLAKQLGIEQTYNNQTLYGFGETNIAGAKRQIHCTIMPRYKPGPKLVTKCVVVPDISNRMPFCPLPASVKEAFLGYDLADPSFWKPAPIDGLLGADLFGEIVSGECIQVAPGLPRLLNTVFGGVAIGPVKANKWSTKDSMALLVMDSPKSEATLSQLVQRFWEVDHNISIPRIHLGDDPCDAHFKATHTREPLGRYVVRLPFKEQEEGILDNAKEICKRRFLNLEYKLMRNPQLKDEYSKIIQEYLSRAYISPAVNEGKYFLPHHGVRNRNSTRLRIVFDASAQHGKGSLNERLMVGPKLQLDIRNILLMFRMKAIAVTADISEMYHQILVHPLDRPFQHFYYRFDTSEPLQEYEFNRLSFGLTCSPFLALRVIRQLIDDEGAAFPHASSVLHKHMYIDDILTGANDLDGALSLCTELKLLLNKGGFHLRKWASNKEAILQTVPMCDRQLVVPLNCSDDPSVKILGLQWNTDQDCISYNIHLPELILTKRGFLSTISRIYDPLGLLAPVTFKAKTIMQRLWSMKLDWDETIPKSLAAEWVNWYNALREIADLKIPRYIVPIEPTRFTLIGFADASSLGYAAVLYLRMEAEGVVVTHLIEAKTRLAPLKTISIPRLELCAALLLVELIRVSDPLFSELTISSTYLCTDSTIVLGWLRLSPSSLKTFVANRVSMTLELSNLNDWYHVASGDNAADIASRGMLPSALSSHDTWWKGPSWLMHDPELWPLRQSDFTRDNPQLPELKPPTVVLLATQSPHSLDEIIIRFSSLPKLVRVMAYMLRFIDRARKRNSNNSSTPRLPSLTEWRRAMVILVKGVQEQYYSECSISPKRASLKSLAPFRDAVGVIRVGGRLDNGPLPEAAKHPIVLPPNAHFTKLLVDHYHLVYLHAGPQLLHSLLQRKFWITAARRIIRSRVHQCTICHRHRVATIEPLMSSLPASRFEQGRPFLNVGTDFAGPFLIKDAPRRKYTLTKSYVCLFVCFSTKAVHMEVVSDLTTEAFLAAFARFTARRGLPTRVFSDHGTNFIGARNRLKNLYSWLTSNATQTTLSGSLADQGIEWMLIPPSAPHFGGLWEAGVKSFKYHFMRVIRDHPLTFEELTTVVARIEAVLNSRPLHPISSSPKEFDVLTPGHFLTGSPLLAIPEPNYLETSTNRLTRWKLLDRFVQDLWKRWRFDYLNNLQQRAKWRLSSPNIDIGTLVLIKEPNIPPLQWPTGRVIETFPGRDGVVRVVKLKCHRGEYVRPVAKLAPLLPCPDE